MKKCKQMLNWGGQNAASNFRDERIDSLKYCLIVLVIAGHVLERFSSPECSVIRNWIYIFHMPLFIFISGYFSHKKQGKDLFSSIWKLLEPLLIFQVIVSINMYFNGTFTWIDAFSPWYVLWYLLCLIFWRLLLQIVPDRLLNNRKTFILILTFAISIIAGFLPFDRFLALQKTFAFLPFFFLGYFMRGKSLFLPNKYKPLSYILLLLAFIVPLFFSQYLGNMNHQLPYSNSFGALYRIFVFCLSIPMSIAFINICPHTSWIAKQGKLTLQYFIYHAFILAPLVAVVSRLNSISPLINVIICTLVLLIGMGIASYLPYFTKFTNPSLFFNLKR